MQPGPQLCMNFWNWCMFAQVCELDIIFNFEKAYFILDEFLMGGEIQDTSKKSVLKAIEQADLLQEVSWPSPQSRRVICGCESQKSKAPLSLLLYQSIRFKWTPIQNQLEMNAHKPPSTTIRW